MKYLAPLHTIICHIAEIALLYNVGVSLLVAGEFIETKKGKTRNREVELIPKLAVCGEPNIQRIATYTYMHSNQIMFKC